MLSLANYRAAAFGALGLGITTIMLFVYVLLTPWIKGVEPNVCICGMRSIYFGADCEFTHSIAHGGSQGFCPR